MGLIILSIIFVIALFDFALVGLIARTLKIWPSYTDLVEEVLFEDNVLYSIRTDIKNKCGNPVITSRINYKSVVLTQKYLIVRNTYLTCLLYVENSNIESYSIEKGFVYDFFRLNVRIDGKVCYLKFKSKYLDVWIDCMRNLNIRKMG